MMLKFIVNSSNTQEFTNFKLSLNKRIQAIEFNSQVLWTLDPPSNQPPIDTRGNFGAHVSGSAISSVVFPQNLKPYAKFQNPTITPSGRKVGFEVIINLIGVFLKVYNLFMIISAHSFQVFISISRTEKKKQRTKGIYKKILEDTMNGLFKNKSLSFYFYQIFKTSYNKLYYRTSFHPPIP